MTGIFVLASGAHSNPHFRQILAPEGPLVKVLGQLSYAPPSPSSEQPMAAGPGHARRVKKLRDMEVAVRYASFGLQCACGGGDVANPLHRLSPAPSSPSPPQTPGPVSQYPCHVLQGTGAPSKLHL